MILFEVVRGVLCKFAVEVYAGYPGLALRLDTKP